MRQIKLIEPVVMLATVLQWLFLATLTGTLVGFATSLFLHALYAMTGVTSTAPAWVFMLLLPVAGLLNGLLLHWGDRLNDTGLKDSSIAAVHQQAGRMPLKTLLIKPVTALITLSFGGSAGKEGPASHLGSTVACAIGQALHLNPALRVRLVACGISAGFASVFGTPVAGAIYGVEILAIGRIRHDFLFPAIVAGIASFEMSKLMAVPYQYYSIALPHDFSEIIFLKTVIIGILCGTVAWLFVYLITRVRSAFEHCWQYFGWWPPLMPVAGGIVMSILIIFIPTDYLGLSLPVMDRALDGQAIPYLGFLWKTLLVAITLGSGFYAGVVTPQFVIGALSGSVFAGFMGLSPALGAAIGLVSVVSAASNAPLAAILMGVELFGQMTGTIYVAGASVAAFLMIGHRGVYPDQIVVFSKSSWMYTKPGLAVGPDHLHLSYGLRRAITRVQHKLRHHSRK